MNRKGVVVAVWKEKLTYNQSLKEAEALVKMVGNQNFPFDISIASNPFSYVGVNNLLKGSDIKSCAQNMLWQPKSGSYIGEVTSQMLVEVGCDYVILGHSERRMNFSETDEMIANKAIEAIRQNICPIVCVGDTNEEKENGTFEDVIKKQLKGLLERLPDSISQTDLIIAYEPVWAISTWRNDLPLPKGEEIQEIHKKLRSIISTLKSDKFGKEVSLLYGGSVAPENGEDYMSQEDVDGALVGGASKTAVSFYNTVLACNNGYAKKNAMPIAEIK